MATTVEQLATSILVAVMNEPRSRIVGAVTNAVRAAVLMNSAAIVRRVVGAGAAVRAWWSAPAAPAGAPPPLEREDEDGGAARSKKARLHLCGRTDQEGKHQGMLWYVRKNPDLLCSASITPAGFLPQPALDVALTADIRCDFHHLKVDSDHTEINLTLRGPCLATLTAFVDSCSLAHSNEACGMLNELCVFHTHAFGSVYRSSYDDRATYGFAPLRTRRTFDNLYLNADVMQQLRARVERLERDPDGWHARTGTPRTLGLLLHGPPGTGKTSTIKALARLTNRHVVFVNLATIESLSSLQAVFMSNIMHANQPGSPQFQVTVPQSRRLLVLEDLDAQTKLVHARPGGAAAGDGDDDDDDDGEKRKHGAGRPRWTLADLLNVLDGVAEADRRILIITSNHPERLDPALLRPGRCDMHVRLGPMERAPMRAMLRDFCGGAEPTAEADQLIDRLDGLCTPAEVTSAILGAECDIMRALRLLCGAHLDQAAAARQAAHKRGRALDDV